MGQAAAYAVVRVHADSYRPDRLTPPGAGRRPSSSCSATGSATRLAGG